MLLAEIQMSLSLSRSFSLSPVRSGKHKGDDRIVQNNDSPGTINLFARERAYPTWRRSIVQRTAVNSPRNNANLFPFLRNSAHDGSVSVVSSEIRLFLPSRSPSIRVTPNLLKVLLKAFLFDSVKIPWKG